MANSLSAIARYSLYALLIFTPLAYGSVQGWAISTIHLLTIIALTALLIQKTWTWDWKWISTPLDIPIVALLIVTILSSIFSMHQRISLWSIILLLNYLTIYYLVIHTINTRSQLRNLTYVIIAVAASLSIFGLMTKLGDNPFPWYDYSHLKRGTDVVSSTYVNPNHFAGYLEMVLPLALGMFLLGFRGGKLILLSYLTLILLTGLLISLSRGGWVSTAMSLAFMASALLVSPFFEKKKLLLSCIGGSLLIALIVLPNRPVVEEILTVSEKAEDVSLSSRVSVWRSTVAMTLDRPFFGTGPGTYTIVFTQYQPPGMIGRYTMAHSDYLHFIAETGLALMAIVIWMIVVFFRKGFSKLKNPSRFVRGTDARCNVRPNRHARSQHLRLQPPHPRKCIAFHCFGCNRCFPHTQIRRTPLASKPHAD